MIDIGKILKEEREKQNLTIEEISKKTLIRPYYIEEIESNRFPYYDGFIASYIRKYANLLGIEEDPLLVAYRELFKEEPLKPGRKNRIPVLIFISVCVILVVFFTIKKITSNYLTSKQPAQEEEIEQPTEQTPPEQTPEQPPVKEPEKISGVHLVLKADARCWLGINVDGKYSQFFLEPGETRELQGKDYIKIRYGNARHVYVTKNGVNLGIASSTETVIDVEYKP
jgi:cytoskeletal protein RodZ